MALHALVLAPVLVAALLQRLPPVGGVRSGGAGIEITLLDRMPAAAQPRLVIEGPRLDAPGVATPFSPSPGMRAFDTSKIAARQDELFPFLASRLGFLDRLNDQRRPERRSPRTPGPVLATPTTPLTLSAAELDAIVDRSWSRRDRWRSLAPIVKLIDRHHPDDGQLPVLVRTYLEHNLLQPYFPAATPDARFWIVLGLAADHADVLRYVSQYVDEHPRTRTATELLFLLDELVEASRDAFNMLTLTSLETLQETARRSPANFALANGLQDGWASWAASRNIRTTDDLDERIRDLRFRILSAIVETSPGGYGVSDAHFLVGRLLWAGGDRKGAEQWWGSMASDGRNSYSEVKAAIRRAFLSDRTVDAAAVVEALDHEHARWLGAATRRLARFGFTPITY